MQIEASFTSRLSKGGSSDDGFFLNTSMSSNPSSITLHSCTQGILKPSSNIKCKLEYHKITIEYATNFLSHIRTCSVSHAVKEEPSPAMTTETHIVTLLNADHGEKIQGHFAWRCSRDVTTFWVVFLTFRMSMNCFIAGVT